MFQWTFSHFFCMAGPYTDQERIILAVVHPLSWICGNIARVHGKLIYFFILHYECSTTEPFNSHYFIHNNHLMQYSWIECVLMLHHHLCFRDSVSEDVHVDVENLHKSINILPENQCNSTPGDHSFLDINILNKYFEHYLWFVSRISQNACLVTIRHTAERYHRF